MRQRFAILVTIVLVLLLLVALNSASYVQIEETPDNEVNPDRSTYNSGATGTRALYDLLQESGRSVVRWRSPVADLLKKDGQTTPATFVVVGNTRLSFETEEITNLIYWVTKGGRLVVIDRTPDARLMPASENWLLTTELQAYPTQDVSSDNMEEMTAGVKPVQPAQPTLLTRDVEKVIPSRFASLIKLSATNNRPASSPSPQPSQAEPPEAEVYEDEEDVPQDKTSARHPTPVPGRSPTTPPTHGASSASANISSPAPVIHLMSERAGGGALLVDYPLGEGRIIILSDPFIVANGGIRGADNLQLALNVVAGREGLIAFDEYHQGRAETQNQMLAYFRGTPILAMFAQFTLILLVILWSNGRRFARPLPLATVDRRSKLEFVASMAELQQRARAYDLAIENIYSRTRRVLARFAGVDAASPKEEIAERVAARSSIDRQQLETLMRECEDAMAGAPLSARKSLSLAMGLREVERTLGLRMRSREIRQAKEL